MKVKAHTILFTEACPLDCRYCILKDSPDYHTCPPLKEEEIMAEIEYHNIHDDPKECHSQLLITGGEPFLYPELVKKIIDKYQNRFSYRFNTSGMLLTEDMLEYLSHYNVSLCLSVDGDYNLTNYLRPVKSAPYHTGYMKELEKILPVILYYFPDTPYRIIVNPRYVDLTYQMYLFGEQRGFRSFSLIPDFRTRPVNPRYPDIKKTLVWTQKDTEALSLQMTQIINEIILGWKNNIQKPRVVEVDEAVSFLLRNKKFDVDELPCQVFAGRTLYALMSKESSHCMSKYYPNIEDCRAEMLKQYEECGGKCKIDPTCSAIEYCWHKSCPKNSLDVYQEFGHFEFLDCALNQVCYYNALYLLKNANEQCGDSELYKAYLHDMGVR